MIKLTFKDKEEDRNEVHAWLGDMSEYQSNQAPPFLLRTPEKVVLVTSCIIRWLDEDSRYAFVYDLAGYAISDQKNQNGEWRTTLTPDSNIKLLKGEITLSNHFK